MQCCELENHAVEIAHVPAAHVCFRLDCIGLWKLAAPAVQHVHVS